MTDDAPEHHERRRRSLTDEDMEALALALAATNSFSVDTHREHHEFIASWIARENRAAERAEKIKAQVGGWGIIVFLTGIGAAVWEWVRAHVR